MSSLLQLTSKIKKSLYCLAAVAMIGSVSSCSDSVGLGPTPQNIMAYYEKDSPRMEAGGKWSAYFDFSGVYIAYDDSLTAQTFNAITQKVTGSLDHYDLYSLANDKIEKLNSQDLQSAANIFEQLHDPSKQGQLYAPIEKTLKKIVDDDCSALLVTDYEEYTPGHQIYQQAYATPYFEQWLKRGKDITFFVTDYVEGGLPKHLYYTVFDDESHRLLKEIEDGLQQSKAHNYKRFTLSMHNYKVGPKAGGTSGAYAGPTIGGTYHDENGDDVVTESVEDGTDNGFNRLPGMRAELYTFGDNWEDIVANAKGQQDAEIPAQHRFCHLFQNLFADFSNADSYRIKELTVRMGDIGKDFALYMNWQTAMRHQPKVTVVEGEKQVDIPSESADYYDENGSLKPEFDYTKLGGNVPSILGVVLFDQELFDNTFRASQGHEAELAVNLNPQFDGTIAGNQTPSGIYRIDIVVASAEPNLGSQIDALFAWPTNNSLSSSIRNVLQHCNPQGSVVYSYFVRMDS